MTRKNYVRIGVANLILKDNKILMLLNKNIPDRRSKYTGKHWSLPGGKFEVGESITDCAKREIKEEVGLTVKNCRLISILEINWKYHKDHWITFLTKTNKFKGIAQIKEPNNHIDIKWFDLDNLPKTIFKADKELIKNYINKVGLSQKIIHYNGKN